MSLDVKEGQTLNAVQQAPLLLRVADLTKMTVWSEVSEADIGLIRRGMEVRFSTLAAKVQKWRTTVRDILPSPPNPSSQQTNSATSQQRNIKAVLYPVLFDIENPNGQLLPQMSAQAFFIVNSAHDVPIVPLRLLTQVPGETNKFIANVVDHGAVRARAVVLGVRNRTHAEVISGLALGDELINPRESGTTGAQGAAH